MDEGDSPALAIKNALNPSSGHHHPNSGHGSCSDGDGGGGSRDSDHDQVSQGLEGYLSPESKDAKHNCSTMEHLFPFLTRYGHYQVLK